MKKNEITDPFDGLQQAWDAHVARLDEIARDHPPRRATRAQILFADRPRLLRYAAAACLALLVARTVPGSAAVCIGEGDSAHAFEMVNYLLTNEKE